MTETLEQTLTAYDAWLDRQPLAAKTRTAYRLQAHQYGAYLAQRPSTTDDLLYTPFVRDYIVRDYKTYLKIERQAKPTSVNLALAALESGGSERNKRFSQTSDTAFFLNASGKRLSARAIDLVIRRIGVDARLELSAHVLRHTCLTNLVRGGNDLVLVAEIAGHKRLETTRRYSLPSIEDRERAMEELRVDY